MSLDLKIPDKLLFTANKVIEYQDPMSESGHLPTYSAARSMSAIGCKADILLRVKSVANDP